MGKRIVIFLAVLLCLGWLLASLLSNPRSVTAPTRMPEHSEEADSPDQRQSTSPAVRGRAGSGHQAGYEWAEENGINDESDCEVAADHSNSPSFGEGCKAYVNGEDAPE